MDLADTVQLLEAMALMPDGDQIVVTKFAGIIDWQQEQPAVVKPKQSTRAKAQCKEVKYNSNLTPIKEANQEATKLVADKKCHGKIKPKPHLKKYDILSSSSDSDGPDSTNLSTSADVYKKRKPGRKGMKAVQIDLDASSDEDEYVVDNDFSQQAEYHDLVNG
jgi:hypothetical protein